MNYEDVYLLCRDSVKLRELLQEKELLGNFTGLCSVCSKGNIFLRTDKSFSKDGICWGCCDRECGKKLYIRQGSWFLKSHLTLAQIVKLTYYWVYKYPAELKAHELRLGSDHTTVDWFNFASEVCVEILEQEQETIGGPGKTVEIDE